MIAKTVAVVRQNEYIYHFLLAQIFFFQFLLFFVAHLALPSQVHPSLHSRSLSPQTAALGAAAIGVNVKAEAEESRARRPLLLARRRPERRRAVERGVERAHDYRRDQEVEGWRDGGTDAERGQEEEEKGGWVGSRIRRRAPTSPPSSSSTHAAASNVRYFNAVPCYAVLPGGGWAGRQTGCGSGDGGAIDRRC